MNIFLILFIFAILKKTKRDERRSDIFKTFFGIYVAFILLSVFTSIPFFGVAIAAFIIYSIWKSQKNKEEKEREKKYNWGQKDQWGGSYTGGQQWNSTRSGNQKGKWNPQDNYGRTSYNTGRVISRILPRQVAKRRKIVQEFNKKFDLYLTDEQIESIVDSSYMSEGWKKEVEAMSQKYETVFEWFQGDTKWLRVYLYAFHMQDVSSDFWQQERIVVTAFEDMMKYSDSLKELSIPERIEKINDKYFAHFNDSTYMIAYRFLESKGLFHELETFTPLKDDEDLDKLMEKYRSMPL